MDLKQNFAERCRRATAAKRSHLCVGIDPIPQLLPDEFKPADPKNLEELAEAFFAFGKTVIDMVVPLVATVKLQSAFFEVAGNSGVESLEKLSAYAQAQDLLVIGDLKRGDIGSTAVAYAQAAFRHHNHRPLYDAVTVNPYLGSDGVLPFLRQAQEVGSGVFVLCKTSNPSSAELQDLEVDGQAIHQHVADLICAWSEEFPGVLGAVVGATHPHLMKSLRQTMPNIWFLIPGFGIQGATAEDAALGFDTEGSQALVNSSRGITFPWFSDSKAPGLDWRQQISSAAAQANSNLNKALAKHG